MNKTFLIGRLTNDPVLEQNDKYTKCKFTLAINRMKEGADYISCVAWNKTAEAIGKYLHKGNQTAIEGHIQTGSYDAQDGTKRYTTDVIVENITFIGNNEKIKEEPEDDLFKGKYSLKADEIEIEDKDLPF